MKKLLQFLSIIVFWAAWPYWYFYFRANNRRSRVLIVVNNEYLVLKGWLSSGAWGLPGGGAHKSESLSASAVRELNEEIGLAIAETALRPLGKRTHNQNGLSYRAEYFALELPEKPELHLQTFEISESQWADLEDTARLKLDQDVIYALKKYQPIDQTELL